MVRLPRDWLGPREELVPVGPAAGPAVAPFGEDGLPPTAEAFWSEDSAALHDAVRAPTAEPASPWAAPAGPPPRPPWRSRAHRPLIPWRRADHLWPRARWTLLVLPIGALLVLALIASAGDPTSPQAGRLSASASAQRKEIARDAAARLATTKSSAAATLPTGKTSRVTPARRRHPNNAVFGLARRPRVRSRATHHTDSRSHRTSRSSPARTPVSPPTSTYVAAPTDSSGTSSGGSSPAVATQPSSDISSTSHPANHTATSASHTPFGENGTLGPGSSPDS